MMVLLHKKGADCEKETVNNAEEESCLRASEMLLSKKHNFQGYEAITEELESLFQQFVMLLRSFSHKIC